MTTSSALCVSNDRFPMPEKSLVIFLHGTGASGARLMPLASSWRSRLAAARFRGAGRAYSPTRVFCSWLEQMNSGVHNTRSSAIIAALLTRRSSLPNSALMRSAAAAIGA